MVSTLRHPEWRQGALWVSRQPMDLLCEESCFGHISIGLFLAAILGVDTKCFLRRISKAKVLLRENGSDLDH